MVRLDAVFLDQARSLVQREHDRLPSYKVNCRWKRPASVLENDQVCVQWTDAHMIPGTH
jgi:hypothetical protein